MKYILSNDIQRVFEDEFQDEIEGLDKYEGDEYNKLYDALYNKFEKEYLTKFVVPEGYKVTSVPKPIKYDGKAYGFDISYEEKDGAIIQHKKIYLNTLRVAKEDFEDWNAFIKDNSDLILNAATFAA